MPCGVVLEAGELGRPTPLNGRFGAPLFDSAKIETVALGRHDHARAGGAVVGRYSAGGTWGRTDSREGAERAARAAFGRCTRNTESDGTMQECETTDGEGRGGSISLYGQQRGHASVLR